MFSAIMGFFVSRTGMVLASSVLVMGGVLMIRDGDPRGWGCVLFFGACGVAVMFLPLVDGRGTPSFRLTIDDAGMTLASRGRVEGIRWDEVQRIVLATTSDGPWLPDVWLIFIPDGGTVFAVPTEAEGFEPLFDVLSSRFPGFDFEPFIFAGTDDADYPCWSRTDVAFHSHPAERPHNRLPPPPA